VRKRHCEMCEGKQGEKGKLQGQRGGWSPARGSADFSMLQHQAQNMGIGRFSQGVGWVLGEAARARSLAGGEHIARVALTLPVESPFLAEVVVISADVQHLRRAATEAQALQLCISE